MSLTPRRVRWYARLFPSIPAPITMTRWLLPAPVMSARSFGSLGSFCSFCSFWLVRFVRPVGPGPPAPTRDISDACHGRQWAMQNRPIEPRPPDRGRARMWCMRRLPRSSRAGANGSSCSSRGGRVLAPAGHLAPALGAADLFPRRGRCGRLKPEHPDRGEDREQGHHGGAAQAPLAVGVDRERLAIREVHAEQEADERESEAEGAAKLAADREREQDPDVAGETEGGDRDAA